MDGPIRKLNATGKAVEVDNQNNAPSGDSADKKVVVKIEDVGDKNKNDIKSEDDSFESYRSDVTLIEIKKEEEKVSQSNKNDKTKELNNNGDNSIIVSSLIGFDCPKL